MVTQAVIKKIALPIEVMLSGNEFLPVLDRCCHSRFPRERHDSMQMIRHEYAQAAMPDESLVIKPHRGKHGVANGRARSPLRAVLVAIQAAARTGVTRPTKRAGRQTQLVFTRRHAVNRDKEPAALGYPLRNCVRQLLAHRQTHALQHTEALRMPKGKR